MEGFLSIKSYSRVSNYATTSLFKRKVLFLVTLRVTLILFFYFVHKGDKGEICSREKKSFSL